MLTQNKDLWAFAKEADAICITTNGFVKKNGCAVMGRGCALEATQMFQGIDASLGTAIFEKGNITQIIREVSRKTSERSDPLAVVSFPVKAILMKVENAKDFNKILPNRRSQFKVGHTVPGFLLKADIGLIRDSLKRLVSLANKNGWETVVLPRPGCGYGGLDWEKVKPELEIHLDDRFIVVHK